MITENISTLKIHKLTQAQYDRELEAGNIDEYALYLTPDDNYYTETEIDEKIEVLNTAISAKADSDHNHDSAYDVAGSANTALDSAKSYTDTAISGLASATSITNAISTHNTSTEAHSDIRTLISDLSTKVNNFLDVDDTTTDQLSEVLAMIEANEGTIESLTSNKVNVSDIIDNLTTADNSKVLSANQGVVLKGLIDAMQEAVDGKADASHSHAISDITNLQTTLDGKASSSHTHSVSQISDLTATATELNYMDGVTSNVQTQLDAKAASGHTHSVSQISDLTATATELNILDGATVTTEELNYVDGVTSNIQTQLNTKADSSHTHGDLYYTETEVDTLLSDVNNLINDKADASHSHEISDVANLQSALDGKAASSHAHTVSEISDLTATATELNYISGVTSNVQTQLDGKVPTSRTINSKALTADIVLTASDIGADAEGSASSALESAQSYADDLASGKSDVGHTHDDMYYTESEIDGKVTEINASIEDIIDGTTVVAESSHASTADNATAATSATSATKATQDSSGNSIVETYETKSDASAKLTEAKSYADGIKDDLLNGAGEAYDTLKELGDLIDENTDAIDALETVAAGKADAEHTHVVSEITDLQEATQSVAGLLSAEDKTQLDYGGVPIVTTSGDGAAYTVTVDGITALTVGTKITIIPHTVSTATQPTLNVNSLGAKAIRMPITYNTSATSVGPIAAWLVANKPVTVQYNGTYWTTVDIPRPSAQYLYGAVPIANGGTGATTAAAALTNLGMVPTAVDTSSVSGNVGTRGSLYFTDLSVNKIGTFIFMVGTLNITPSVAAAYYTINIIGVPASASWGIVNFAPTSGISANDIGLSGILEDRGDGVTTSLQILDTSKITTNSLFTVNFNAIYLATT